ncbi:MAG: hypothetical protein ABI621_12945, partial [Chloroflexota bacterium]
MALKGRLSRTILNLSFLALDISLFSNLILPSAQGKIGYALREVNSSDLSTATVIDETTVLSSVYIGDEIALPVVQQPEGDPNYVSTKDGEVTQFSTVSEYGNIGLLAHNYLSGKYFLQLSMGQEVRLVYGDGQTEHFIIAEILHYQALEPSSPYSSFRNLNNKDEILSAVEMFNRVYG